MNGENYSYFYHVLNKYKLVAEVNVNGCKTCSLVQMHRARLDGTSLGRHVGSFKRAVDFCPCVLPQTIKYHGRAFNKQHTSNPVFIPRLFPHNHHSDTRPMHTILVK